MKPETRIQQDVIRALADLNLTLEQFTATSNQQRSDFWYQRADEYIDRFRDDISDPKYRFDPEWQEFWDVVEQLYPETLEFSVK